jgi:hypothetical protein
MPHQTHKEEQEKEKLKQIIEELQSQNKHLREVTTTQGHNDFFIQRYIILGFSISIIKAKT